PPPTTPPPVTDCPCETGWTYFLGTDSCYKLDCNGTFNGTHVVNATGRTVYAARNSCLALGADLVSVHSPQEQALLYAVAGNVRDLGDYRESIWIGLYRTDVATQNWMWTDGTPYDAAYFVQMDYAPAAAFVPRYNGWQTTGGWHDISPDAAGWSDGGYKYAICKKK
ncbi:CLEC-50 protein, partial [Aphelenchoides avenae]